MINHRKCQYYNKNSVSHLGSTAFFLRNCTEIVVPPSQFFVTQNFLVNFTIRASLHGFKTCFFVESKSSSNFSLELFLQLCPNVLVHCAKREREREREKYEIITPSSSEKYRTNKQLCQALAFVFLIPPVTHIPLSFQIVLDNKW